MKVTKLPHDGRMIMGGKGSITPFNPSQTTSSAPKSGSAPAAPAQTSPSSASAGLMQAAVDLMEEAYATPKSSGKS